MLSEVEAVLAGRGLVDVGWRYEMDVWGTRVKQYRDYYEGRHPTYLTGKMRALLRSNGFADNYCGLVVDTAAARLTVRSITADDDEAATWAADVLAAARFDALQIDTHDAALRDGDAFVLVSYVEGAARFSLELAWDGETGILPVYDRTRENLVAAVKVWAEKSETRVNFYFPDEVVKYRTRDGALVEIERAAWLPGVVPLVHFQNRRAAKTVIGMSELATVLPMQDALNRTLISMVMAGEMTAFQIRVARGFTPPDEIAPGSWVVIGADGLSRDDVADVSVLGAGEIVPFIDQAKFIIDQISTVTATPIPMMMGGAGESGEALKERQTALTAKVERMQVKLGNAWEDVVGLAAQLQNTFGTETVSETGWMCRWKDAQTRNAKDYIDAAVKVRDAVSEREFLRMMGVVFGWDEAHISQILRERAEDAAEQLTQLAGGVPGFSNFGTAV